MSTPTDRRLGFSSLDDEIETALPVEGEVPEWLSGTLLRNGPGSFRVGETGEVDHWFDGLAMVHAFSFADSERTDAELVYRNRFLETDAYRAARAGEFHGGFATGESTLRERLRGLVFGDAYDNTNIIVERLGERYYALTESPRWVTIDPVSLELLGEHQYRGSLPNGQITCSHVHRDPESDALVTFDTEFGRQCFYHVHETSSEGRREHVVSIPVDTPAYMHSFALTPRFVVLTEFPLVVDPLDAFRPGKQGGFITNFEWQPERGTRFFVIDRERNQVLARPRTEAVFGFHHVNAYERGDPDGEGIAGRELVVDIETVPDTESIAALSLDALREGVIDVPGGAIERFRIAIQGRADADIERELRYPGATGLPTVSPARWCEPYRYLYAQSAPQPMVDWPKAVRKIDVESGDSRAFADGESYLSEPIFVPRPPVDNGNDECERSGRRAGWAGTRERAEDDGVVLVVALDTAAERSSLLVLDGEEMTERARAPIPHAIPFDFHGRYFPEL